MSQPPFINLFLLGRKFSFVSVIFWEVGGMRLKERHFPHQNLFSSNSVLLRTGSLSGYTCNHGNILFTGGREKKA